MVYGSTGVFAMELGGRWWLILQKAVLPTSKEMVTTPQLGIYGRHSRDQEEVAAQEGRSPGDSLSGTANICYPGKTSLQTLFTSYSKGEAD